MFQLPQAGPSLLVSDEFIPYSTADHHSGWASDWDALDLATQPLRGARPTIEPSVELDAAQLQQARAAIDKIWKQHQNRGLPPKWKRPWASYPAQPLAFAVMQQSGQQRKNQAPGNSLTSLIQGVQLMHYLQAESTSWDQYYWCMELEQQLLQRLHRVAADDRLTARQLMEAAAKVFAVLQDAVPAQQMLRNRQVVYWQMLRREGSMWDTEKRNIANDEVFAASFPERVRFWSLMTLSDNWSVGRREFSSPYDMRRWAATTVTEPSDLLTDPVFSRYQSAPTSHVDDIVVPLDRQLQQQLIGAEQATWVILEMQVYRRVHQEFPDRVAQILPSVDRENHVQQSIREQFQFRYAKSGLELPACCAATRTLIPAGQPILWSNNGESCLNCASDVLGELQADDATEFTIDPNRIVYLDGSNAVRPSED